MFLYFDSVVIGTDLSDLQRYQAVVRALASEVTSRLSSVLATPQEADRYAAVKSAALLAQMSDLNRAEGFLLSEEKLRHCHINFLPTLVRAQLATVRQDLSMPKY